MNKKNLAGFGAIIMTLLAFLAGAPYALGDVSIIIPPEYKEKLFVASAVAAAILKAVRDHRTETK
jgi:hypothetical protein